MEIIIISSIVVNIIVFVILFKRQDKLKTQIKNLQTTIKTQESTIGEMVVNIHLLTTSSQNLNDICEKQNETLDILVGRLV